MVTKARPHSAVPSPPIVSFSQCGIRLATENLRTRRNVMSNTIAMSPMPAPSSADHQMSRARKLVLPAKPNSGCAPTIDTSVAYATTDAISDGSSASCARSSLYGISSANTIPVSGARNTADIPAAAPLINMMRRSRASRPKRRSLVHSHDPIAPPL